MTNEEIKKLAEECSLYYQGRPAKRGYELSNRLTIESYALMTIKWLSKDYCIVPKSKVIGLWNEINNDAKTNIENGFPDYAQFNKLQLTPIELLFGKDIFKEEKEI